MKRIIAVLVALMMTVAACATAQENQNTYGIGNIVIGYGEEAAYPIDLSGAVSVWHDEGATYVELAADGTDKTIGRVVARVADGDIQVALDGMTDVYAISIEEIEGALRDSVEYDPEIMNEEQAFSLLTSVFSGIARMIGSMDGVMRMNSDPAIYAKQIKMLLDMAQSTAGEAEDVSVLGETHTYARHAFSLDMQKMQTFVNAACEEWPALREYLEAYIDILRIVPEMGFQNATAENFFSEALGQMGTDMQLDVVLWTSDDYLTGRWEMDMRMTMNGSEEEPIEMRMPMVMEYQVREGEIHEVVSITGDDGVQGYCEYHDTADARVISFSESVPDGQNGEAAVAFDYRGNKADDGETGAFSVEMQIPMSDGAASVVSFACDTMYVTGAPDPDLQSAFDGKPVVRISEMDAAALDKVSAELQLVGFQAMGAFFQTQGVPKIMSEIMTWTTRNIYVDDAYQYDYDFGEYPGDVPEAESDMPLVDGTKVAA